MAGIDWVELSRAIPYAGVAIIFGLFMVSVLRIIGAQRDADAKRQDAKDERLAKQQVDRDKQRDSEFLASIERMTKDWRDFLVNQQAIRGEQWAGVAVELKQLTAMVILTSNMLREHDSWERGMLSVMRGRRRDDEAYPKAMGVTDQPSSVLDPRD